MANLLKAALIAAVSAVLLAGCANEKSRTGEDISIVDADEQKAKLLAKIENKYESPEAHYQLAELYHADRLYDKAEFHYNVALGFDPVYHEAQAGMIQTLMDAGREPRAKVAAEFFINQVSHSAESSVRLAKAFQKERLDDFALACYEQALGLAPNSAAINRQIGYYHLSKGDNVRAEEYLKRSFQLGPYQAEVAGELGRLGVIVQIPRKKEADTQKIDRVLNEE